MLGTAIELASTVFSKTKDKGSNPYILHCLQVMYWVDQSDDELMQIAVLHDVVEDSSYNIQDLRKMGFSKRVCDAVTLLTHEDEDSYEEYIRKISTSSDAIAVKLADLRHNSDITRMKGLRDKDIARLEKYHRAYNYLKSVKEIKF